MVIMMDNASIQNLTAVVSRDISISSATDLSSRTSTILKTDDEISILASTSITPAALETMFYATSKVAIIMSNV